MRNLKRLALLAAVCFSAAGQSPGQNNDKQLTFDAAAIKPFSLPTGGRGMIMDRGGRGGPGSTDPGRIHYPASTLKNLLTIAYDVKDYQISGPGFLDSERFDVQATMPPETTKEQFRTMLQNLLAERFKMAVHRETKELPMYSLIVAKNGSKMKESPEISPEEEAKDPTPPSFPTGPPKLGPDGFPNLPLPSGGRGGLFMIMTPFGARLTGQRQTMQQLVERLSSVLSKPVIDATELKAKYDFTLTYAMEGLNNGMMMLGPPGGGEGGRGPRQMPDVEPPQNIFLAIQSQLGLKLDPKKGNVDLIVVDHAEKTPTEN
ncbi:MAG TPA: TIGR03435 family protein [Bryobacteraceae bacterium]|jgi:uncharacterized protein (TIGR03435 family)|nr:TIGR03435 family protein [Bryobacteraceae bacterium]